MIANFDELKKQLDELSSVINSFKSEAVQLKIIETVFSRASASPGPANPAVTLPPAIRSVKKRSKPPSSSGDATKPGSRAPSGSGAIATVMKTFETGFFKQPRTINAILQHCETNLARKIRANEISGKLARMVRSNQLKRAKNSDGQYEYTNV